MLYKIEQPLDKNMRDLEKQKNRQKKYYWDNKEIRNANYKKWYYLNKEKVRQKERTRENERKLNDPLFKLERNIRGRIRMCIKRAGFIKNNKTEKILGCYYNEFKLYLESKFEPWMNWNNYGKYSGELNYGWDIDHIIPISSAKNEDDIYKLNHYTNLQPLCSKVNRDIKKDKINYEK